MKINGLLRNTRRHATVTRKRRSHEGRNRARFRTRVDVFPRLHERPLFSFQALFMTSRKPSSRVETGRVSFRDTPDVVRFYKKAAQARGVSFSEYARRLTERGALAESVDRLIGSVDASIAKAETLLQEARQLSGAATPTGQKSPLAAMPPQLVEAIFVCEFLLTEIVSRTDMTAERRARDAAKERTAEVLRGVQK